MIYVGINLGFFSFANKATLSFSFISTYFNEFYVLFFFFKKKQSVLEQASDASRFALKTQMKRTGMCR